MAIATLPDLRSLRRLVILRLSSIGDVIHALPVSAALGEAYPHLEITWVVEEMSAEVVTGNPYLHDVIVVPRSRWKQGRTRSPRIWWEYLAFLAALRRRRFDVSLDLQGYGKSALMALAAGAPYRFGIGRMRDGAGLVSHPLPQRPESVHRTDRFLDVVRAFGIEPNPVRFPLFVPEEARTRVTELLCAGNIRPDRPYAVLNPATGNEVRRWGAFRYARLAVALAESYGLPSVLIGSGKDIPLCEDVRTRALAEMAGKQISGVPAPVSLAGQTNLKELASVLEGCAVQVCGDTGSAHIAAALGRPTIALYGPTDPAFAGPWGQQDSVLSRRDLCTASCTVRACAVAEAARPAEPGEDANGGPAGPMTARCLSAITPEEVCKKVGQVLYGRKDE